MLTAEAIAEGKKSTPFSWGSEGLHEHDDCIRIAYEWLDAQSKTRKPVRKSRPLKHIIEQWGGRYISQSDVEVAAHMHPEVIGSYPHFNISARLVSPSFERLAEIGEANTQKNYRDSYERDFRTTYSSLE